MSGFLIVLAVLVGIALGAAFYLRRKERGEIGGDVDPGEPESSPKVR